MWNRRCTGLVVATLVLTAAACSGSSSTKSSPTTTKATTPTSTTTEGAATRAAVTAYLLGPGAPLVTFHRESAGLATGQRLTPQQCQTIAAGLSAKPDDAMFNLADRTPGTVMRAALRDDVFTKNLLFNECIQGHKVKMLVWTGMAKFHNRVTDLMREYGVPA